MSSSSIFKNIAIRNRRSALALLRTIETAKQAEPHTIPNPGIFQDASREEIRQMFSAKK